MHGWVYSNDVTDKHTHMSAGELHNGGTETSITESLWCRVEVCMPSIDCMNL